jgi:hypothetical protein
MIYEPDFLTIGEECGLLDVIRTLPLSEARYRQYTANRRTLNYGSIYDFTPVYRSPAQRACVFVRTRGRPNEKGCFRTGARAALGVRPA